MWLTPHHVAMESGSSQVHHRTTEPQSTSLKAAGKTLGRGRKSMFLRAAARAKRTTLADSSCSFLPGSMTVPREMTYRRLVSSGSYIVTLMVLMAVGRAGGLGWSTIKLLDNVEVLYLKHLFRQEEESAAVNPLNATRGLWLDKFFLVPASHPPEAQPGDLKRGQRRTRSALQVDNNNLCEPQRKSAPLDLRQKNHCPLHVKHPLRHSSDKLLAKYGQTTRAQEEAGNPQSLQMEWARSAASRTN